MRNQIGRKDGIFGGKITGRKLIKIEELEQKTKN